ncbi:hypothetical protein SSPSH_001434 [Salinisphaera shabanensis E1L3A]|uniref:Uncharacterized protein n=1 Tax=Salinisphaera shabanensis E1L3A TaxID=1033802 RepID=U2FUP6_9GAMM|nr:hypothetical protein SSPSH_001434 [Salinisphaera shabanensis E1L3A]
MNPYRAGNSVAAHGFSNVRRIDGETNNETARFRPYVGVMKINILREIVARHRRLDCHISETGVLQAVPGVTRVLVCVIRTC